MPVPDTSKALSCRLPSIRPSGCAPRPLLLMGAPSPSTQPENSVRMSACAPRAAVDSKKTPSKVRAMTDIAGNLERVRAAIERAATKAGRDPRSVALMAVSKTHPADAITHAFAAGQRLFGENRVQEAQKKFPALRAAHPALKLHLIGPLQTNKTVDAVRTLD